MGFVVVSEAFHDKLMISSAGIDMEGKMVKTSDQVMNSSATAEVDMEGKMVMNSSETGDVDMEGKMVD